MDWQKTVVLVPFVFKLIFFTSASFILRYKINWAVAESNLLPQEMSVNQMAICFLPKKNNILPSVCPSVGLFHIGKTYNYQIINLFQ